MDQGRNEVRVMTVHGAKGLEAPIVFLPDTCSASSGGAIGGLIELVDGPRPVGVDRRVRAVAGEGHERKRRHPASEAGASARRS